MAKMPADIQSRLHAGAEAMMLACSTIDEQFFASQILLSGNLLIDSINSALDDLNAHRVRDIEFAFNDFEQLVSELPPPDLENFGSCVSMLRSSIEELRERAALPANVLGRLKSLRSKAKERQTAHERALFRPPDAPDEPLPHDPASLREEADALRGILMDQGFETPMMDQLAESPESFGLRDYSTLIDEIDGIVG